jgi:hypothetical protein
MATLIKNTSIEGPLPLPPVYGEHLVPVGGQVIIADTPANVAAALGNPPASVCVLTATGDGQAGAISPATTGAAGALSYAPTTPGNWSPAPSNIGAALDTVAAGGLVVGSRSTTITLAQLQALGVGVKSHAFAIGAVLPANARILGNDIGETGLVLVDDATHATFSVELGGAGAADLAADVNVSAGQTGFPKAGTPGTLGVPMAPQGGQQLNATIHSTVDLNTVTVGNVPVKVWYTVSP